VIVPPNAPIIGWVTDAIVPSTITLNEADFVESSTLLAVRDTVYGVGAKVGAV
jgi:hypothetical protein